jgi:hypothetical protein
MFERVGEFVVGSAVLMILGLAVAFPVEWTQGTLALRPRVLLVHSGGVDLTVKERRTLRIPRRLPCESVDPPLRAEQPKTTPRPLADNASRHSTG